MPAIDVYHDIDQLTITITAEFSLTVQALWELHTRPELLEKWYAHTISHLELQPRGHMDYTLPDDTTQHYWEFIEIHPEALLFFNRGISDGAGAGEVTARHRVEFHETDDGARLHIRVRYMSPEDLQAALDADAVDAAHQAMIRLDAAGGSVS